MLYLGFEDIAFESTLYFSTETISNLDLETFFFKLQTTQYPQMLPRYVKLLFKLYYFWLKLLQLLPLARWQIRFRSTQWQGRITQFLVAFFKAYICNVTMTPKIFGYFAWKRRFNPRGFSPHFVGSLISGEAKHAHSLEQQPILLFSS